MKTKSIGLICGILGGLIGCGSSTPNVATCNVGTGTLWYEGCYGPAPGNNVLTKDGLECVKCTVVDPNGPVQGVPVSIPDGGVCVSQFGGPMGNMRVCVDSCQQCD